MGGVEILGVHKLCGVAPFGSTGPRVEESYLLQTVDTALCDKTNKANIKLMTRLCWIRKESLNPLHILADSATSDPTTNARCDTYGTPLRTQEYSHTRLRCNLSVVSLRVSIMNESNQLSSIIY